MKTSTATGLKLFIVEDDDYFRETFIDAMALEGAQVAGARGGYEALKALQSLTPSLIIIDVQLPDIHGFELCRCIKKSDRLKDVPVAFLTASADYSDPRDRAEGLLSGAALFLPKPIAMEKLWEEIELLLARH